MIFISMRCLSLWTLNISPTTCRSIHHGLINFCLHSGIDRLSQSMLDRSEFRQASERLNLARLHIRFASKRLGGLMSGGGGGEGLKLGYGVGGRSIIWRLLA